MANSQPGWHDNHGIGARGTKLVNLNESDVHNLVVMLFLLAYHTRSKTMIPVLDSNICSELKYLTS